MSEAHCSHPCKVYSGEQYNLCGLHSSQDGRGLDYENLLKSYQIMFCGFTVFPETEGFFSRFQFRDEYGAELLNSVGIVFVEMSKLGKLLKKPIDELTEIEQWALFFKYASEPEFKETLAEIAAKREAIKMATELLTNISKDVDERARFRSRRMFIMDETTNRNAARAEGHAEGRIEGRIEGRNEGRIEGRNEGRADERAAIARNLIALKLSPADVAKATGLTTDEVNDLGV